MSREDKRRYDIALQKLRVEMEAKPRANRSTDYALAGASAFVGWAAVRYGGAPFVWLSSLLFALAFYAFTKSALAGTKPIIRFGTPGLVAILLIVGAIILTGKDKLTPSSIPDLVSPVQISRKMALMPIGIDPHSTAYIVTFRSDRTVNRQIQQNPESTHFLWPINFMGHQHNIDDIFEYQMVNRDKASVYNLRTIFKIEFSSQAGKNFVPLSTSTPELIIDRTLLPPGVPFTFYAVNQSPYYVRISPPPVVTLQLEGESRTREALLGKLILEAPDAFPIELAPTANTWEGDRIR